jgi:hypothetical protein
VYSARVGSIVAGVPSIDELRAEAARRGVAAADEDLERVQAFLAVLAPAFEALEALVPPGTVPAGLFVPPAEP